MSSKPQLGILGIPIKYRARAESSPPVIGVNQTSSIPQPINSCHLSNHCGHSIVSQSELQLLVVTWIVPQTLKSKKQTHIRTKCQKPKCMLVKVFYNKWNPDDQNWRVLTGRRTAGLYVDDDDGSWENAEEEKAKGFNGDNSIAIPIPTP